MVPLRRHAVGGSALLSAVLVYCVNAGGLQMSTAMQTQPPSSIVSWTQIIYALHAFSLLTGILGAATVVGAFLTGWPSIIAVILNYIKRGEARGTWVDSHFQWQIRTFWFGLLWISLCIAFIILTLGIC